MVVLICCMREEKFLASSADDEDADAEPSSRLPDIADKGTDLDIGSSLDDGLTGAQRGCPHETSPFTIHTRL